MQRPSHYATRQSRRNAIDYHAMGLPKDHWHSTLKKEIVCNRPDHLFGIFFHAHGNTLLCPTLGVALTQCEYGGEGPEYRHSRMRDLLPSTISALGSEAVLLITWPGYAHLGYRAVIYLDTTTGEFASQITRIFREFYDGHHQNFQAPGIRLGPAFVTFDRLRLRSAYFDGQYWMLESEYVYEHDIAWDWI